MSDLAGRLLLGKRCERVHSGGSSVSSEEVSELAKSHLLWAWKQDCQGEIITSEHPTAEGLKHKTFWTGPSQYMEVSFAVLCGC